MAARFMTLLLSCSFIALAWTTVVVKDPICLDGAFHKAAPSPEGVDYAACHMFKNSSCCTADFTKQLSASPIKKVGNFSWQTCGQLSAKCESYMKEIECFYQCSPLVGYWKGQYTGSFVGVPLCSNVCDSWFDACKSDLTCASNWISDFNVSADGSNTCKTDKMCKNFTEVYGDARGLCEGMWGSSFKYTVSTAPHDCLTLNFSLPIADANYEVVLNKFGTKGDGWMIQGNTLMVALLSVFSVVALRGLVSM